jgi:histidine triad (HIT) family protein
MPLVLPAQTPCSYCENFAGRHPWHGPPAVVFDDGLLCIFLAPAALGGMEGHTLVTTRRHVSTILEVSPEEEAALGHAVARASRAIAAAFDPDGILVEQHNGVAAYQSVPHIHFHVIPLRQGSTYPPERPVDITPAAERAALATELRRHWNA